MEKYIKTILHVFSIKILKQYHQLWYMFLLYLNVIIDQKGHGYSNMIDKRIHVNTIMGPVSTTNECLIDKAETSLGRNWDCKIDNEFKFDYRRECVRVFRYTKVKNDTI